MSRSGSFALSALLLAASTGMARANVITDWDELGSKAVQPIPPTPNSLPPNLGYRALAMMHLAMFSAVNAIEPRYKPYKITVSARPDTSQEAAAASAAANVLSKVAPAGGAPAALVTYLAAIPDGEAKTRGIKLGEEAAAKMLELCAHDGADTPNAYRPVTQPGVFVPTAYTVGWEGIEATPFGLTKPSQFRPGAPPDLKGEQWAADYNEVRSLGEKGSQTRTAKQTEDARFWLTTGNPATHPIERQIVISKNMSIVESARFMSIVSMVEADALIAVFDAKYHYQFWRPMTAIRNGDIDGNPATERVPTWQPIDVTPAHPEYPCAHCIVSQAGATAMATMLGSSDIPKVAFSTPTAPSGVVHQFTNLDALAEEVSNARIYAGFHYRTSTVVGRDMGRQIGTYIVQNYMQVQ